MKTAGSIKLLSLQNNVTFNYKSSEKLYLEKKLEGETFCDILLPWK